MESEGFGGHPEHQVVDSLDLQAELWSHWFCVRKFVRRQASQDLLRFGSRQRWGKEESGAAEVRRDKDVIPGVANF